MIFVDGKQQKHNESTKGHATNIKIIISTTRHKKCFSTSNTKVKSKNNTALIARSDQGSMALTWMKTLELGVAMRRELLFARRVDVLLLRIT